MITSLLDTFPTYFDTQPSGRILNRLSKDINTLDSDIPSSLS